MPSPAEPPAPEWTFQEYRINSPHPYANDFSGQAAITAPQGATEMRLHFSRIDTEANYDFVVIRSPGGDKLAEWSGNVGAVVSEPLPHGAVTLHLFTDGSVTEWGLELAGYSWR